MTHRYGNICDYKRILETCEYATFFHTYEWFALWNQENKSKLEINIFELNGKEILVPLIISRHFKFLYSASNSPFGTYGGYICQEYLTNKEFREIFDCLKLKYSHVFLVGNPFLKKQIPGSKILFTQLIDLTKSEESIISNFGKSQILQKLKKAKRKNLRIDELKSNDLEGYYKLYKKRMLEWDIIKAEYSFSCFERIFALKNAKFYGVKVQDELIAGGVFFTFKSHVVYWHGTINSEYFKLSPTKFLFYNLILKYKDEGYKVFDFNPSANLEGVVKFKASFGAEKVFFNNIEYSSRFFLKLTRLRGILKMS